MLNRHIFLSFKFFCLPLALEPNDEPGSGLTGVGWKRALSARSPALSGWKALTYFGRLLATRTAGIIPFFLISTAP
jgi:hypothetical protein